MKISITTKNYIQALFLGVSVGLIALFLVFSDNLVTSLGQEEQTKMAIWAEAYSQFLLADDNADMTLVQQVMASNTTIPVFFTDQWGELQGCSNLTIPADTAAFIAQRVKELTAEGHVFDFEISEGLHQYLYYDESILLQKLHYYPYVQLTVVIVLLLLLYYMVYSRRVSEQNRVWVGLSKETAHQLGTPIQSLMGWTEYLGQLSEDEVEPEALADVATEMNKDVQRLRVVADRFSKIGSEPRLEEADLGEIIASVAEYMQKRVSQRVAIQTQLPAQPVRRMVSAQLLSWVIENLCKNAVDAQPTRVCIRLGTDGSIEVEDDGKGIPKNRQKKIFEAGYTTKQRGWGLGLALVKRIVTQYHHGRIFVKSSAVGVGTTFRIEM